MILRRLIVVLLCWASAGTPLPAHAAPKVVASVIPVHSLVAGVMAGLGAPELLVPANASAHGYQLRPSDAARLARAAVVFQVSEDFESFLQKPLASLGDDARVITLISIPELTRLRNRPAGVWEERAPDIDPDEHTHGIIDPHIWLDPGNAIKIVDRVVAELSDADPDNANRYASNGMELIHRIDAMDKDIAQRLHPVRHVPYIVFHDAYQYLERSYGLNAAGSITLGPDKQPGAKRLRALRDLISRSNHGCIFGEAQFNSAIIDTLLEGSTWRAAVLDALGAALDPGPNAYFQLMTRNATAISDCLND